MTAKSLLKITSAIHAMIGYCQSLNVVTVITEAYMSRMNDYYIPRLEAVLRGCNPHVQGLNLSPKRVQKIEKIEHESFRGASFRPECMAALDRRPRLS